MAPIFLKGLQTAVKQHSHDKKFQMA